MNLGSVREWVAAVRRGLSAGRLRVAAVACVLVALGSWAVATPVGGSPDEDYHLVSIWCSHGTRAGLCESPTADSAVIPAALRAETCLAFQPAKSAACTRDVPENRLIRTTRGNFDGSYPPVFYWVDGIFAGPHIAASVITMRIVNLLLFLAIFIWVYLLLPPGLRRAQLIGTVVTVVPLGLFLIASVNPSGWAILSAATFLVSVLGYLTAPDRRRRIALGAAAGLTLLVGAGARGDAAMYAVIAVIAAAILTVRSAQVPWRRFAYPAVLVVVAGLAFLSVGQTGAANPGEGATNHIPLGRSLRIAFDVPALWAGSMGSPAPFNSNPPVWAWGLGWLDTPMPAAVWVGAGGVFAAVLFAAVARADRRTAAAVAFVGLVVFLVPTYIQALSDTPVGGLVQPRYVLPLLILLVVVATFRLDGTPFRLTRGQVWIVVATLAVANGAALYANLRRYVTGTDGKDWNLDRNPSWWWNTSVPPMAVCVVGAIAFALALALIAPDLTTDTTRIGVPGSAGGEPYPTTQSPRETVPDPRETVPEPRKTVPDPRETVPEPSPDAESRPLPSSVAARGSDT